MPAAIPLPPYDFSDHVALVTGASRGLGKAITIELAKRGAKIIAIGRDEAALNGLQQQFDSITPIAMDLTNRANIEQLHKHIDRLDIFVANAGILGTLQPLSAIEPEIFAKVIDVNLVSQWHMIRLCEPLLRRSAHGRAALISSTVGHTARALWGGYAVSKAGLEMLGCIWAAELANTNIKVNLVNPGAMRTQMRAQAMPNEDPNILPTVEEIAQKLLPLFSKELTQTGQLFDARKECFLTYTPPADSSDARRR